MGSVALPLFPLQVVLFPQMALWLHIFEARYLAMIKRCLEADRTFGVALIRAGQEGGSTAEPHAVGTSAFILDATPQPDGRMDLLVLGQRRFRLRERLQADPYLIGRVDWFPESGRGARKRLPEVTNGLRQSLEELLASGDGPSDVEIPDDPVELSYVVASLLPIALSEKQQLLEIPRVDARLHQEKLLLEREIAARRRRCSVPRRVLHPTDPEDFAWFDRWTN